MRLWRVRFGNYEPAEVDSTHTSEALADARRDELNVGTFMWEVDSIEVAAPPADATLLHGGRPRPAATDGSDFHDSPIRDCTLACPICKYTGPIQPHRSHPGGGWERIEDKIVIWVPPPVVSEQAATRLIKDCSGEPRERKR